MKHSLLTLLLFFLFSDSNARHYVSVRKANASTQGILISNARDIAFLRSHLSDFAEITGLRIDYRALDTIATETINKMVCSFNSLEDLELVYWGDSNVFKNLNCVKSIEYLRLESMSGEYGELSLLSHFKNLEFLSLKVNTLDAIPAIVYTVYTLDEVEIFADTFNSRLSTELCMSIPYQGKNRKKLCFSSNIDAIDLNADSFRSRIMGHYTSAELYRSSNTFGGGGRPEKRNKMPQTQNKPYLKPLFPGTEQKFETATISSENVSTVLFNDNSVLNVPANAFINPDGSIYKGNVELTYRSVRSQAEMLGSGVPMTYDTAGNTELFLSDGMFEISAAGGNNALQLARGKSLSIQFESKNMGTGFNFYSLDLGDGKWNYLNPLNYSVTNIATYYTMKDKATFQERYDDLEYTYLLPKTLKSGMITCYNKRHGRILFDWEIDASPLKKLSKIRNNKTLIKLRVINELCNKKEGKVCFEIPMDNLSGNINITKQLFPELNTFHHFIFEYDGFISSLEFSKKFKKGKVYTDIRIYYEAGAETAEIELKTRTGFIVIPVKVSRPGFKNSKRINKVFVRNFTKYSRILKSKESSFNTFISATYTNSDNKRISMKVYDSKTIGKSGKKTYKLDVPMLSLFNCDQLYRMENRVIVEQAVFVNKGDTLNSLLNIYVVDAAANGTYTFTRNFFYFSDNNTLGFIISDLQGNVYTCKRSDLPSTGSKKMKAPIIEVKKVNETDPDKIVAVLDR